MQKRHLKLVKSSTEVDGPSPRPTTEHRLSFGAPLTGLAVAVLFYFVGPWFSSLLNPTLSHPAWVYSLFGFGIGTSIGIPIFGTFRDPP